MPVAAKAKKTGLAALGVTSSEVESLAIVRRVGSYSHEANTPVIFIEHDDPTDDDRVRALFDLLCELDIRAALELIKDYTTDLNAYDLALLKDRFIKALDLIAGPETKFVAGDQDELTYGFYPSDYQAVTLTEDEEEDVPKKEGPKRRKAPAKSKKPLEEKQAAPIVSSSRGSDDEQADSGVDTSAARPKRTVKRAQPAKQPATSKSATEDKQNYDPDEAIRRVIEQEAAKGGDLGPELRGMDAIVETSRG